MQNVFRVGITLFALTSPLLAQFDIEGTFVAATELRCTGQAPTAFFYESRTLPQGTDLTRGAALGVYGPGLNVTLNATYENHPRRLMAAIHEQGRVAAAHGSVFVGATTPHETLLTLRARTPTRVRLVVTSSSSGSATQYASWSRSASVDVGDDGTNEITQLSGRYERVVDLGAAPLPIRTRTSLGAVTSSIPIEAQGSVVIEVLPVSAVVATHVAATHLTAYAGGVGSSLAAGSMLAPSALVRAYYGESAWLTSSLSSTVDEIAVRIDEGNALSVFPSGSTVGPHDTLLTLVAETPRRLRIALAATSMTGPPGTSMHLGRIDVGDDGTFEVTSISGRTVTAQVEVVVGPTPLRIRTRSSGSAGPPPYALFAGTLTITVTPALRCTATTYGNVCGVGARLAARANLDNALQLDLTDATPNAIGKLILGVASADLPLPFSNCRLYVDLAAPSVFVPLQTDRFGRVSRDFAVPPGLALTVFAQDVFVTSLTPLALEGSTAVRLDCR